MCSAQIEEVKSQAASNSLIARVLKRAFRSTILLLRKASCATRKYLSSMLFVSTSEKQVFELLEGTKEAAYASKLWS